MFRHKCTYTIPALWLILVAPLTALAADACPKADTAAQVARDAGQQWQKVLDGRDADSLDDLSAPEREAIGAYKKTLSDAIDARLACSDDKTDPAVLRRTLATTLGATDQTAPPADSASLPGQLLIEVERSTAPRPLMLVRAGFAIPCGDDNLLTGYAWEGDGWQRVLHWQSGDYQDVSGAYGDGFSFATLPGGQVVIAHGTPWCTSTWSRFRAAVIVPANGAVAQRVLFQTEASYRREESLRLKKLADGFEVRAPVASHDPDVLIRPGIFRYRVDGETVRRVQPAAANGRDFVDEWLGLDDTLARAWSDPGAADAALRARQRLRAHIEATGTFIGYGPVRACAAGKDRYQVAMELADLAGQPPQNWYALIRQEKNGFTMLGLGTAPDASCHGPDLMGKRAPARATATSPANPDKDRQPLTR